MRQDLTEALSLELAKVIGGFSNKTPLDENEVVMACFLCCMKCLRASGHKNTVEAANFTLDGVATFVAMIRDKTEKG